jgi:hypothetical protein
MNPEFRPHRGIKVPPPISDIDPSIALTVARQWERCRENDFVDLSAREVARQARIARWIRRGERARSLLRRLASFFGLSGSVIRPRGLGAPARSARRSSPT